MPKRVRDTTDIEPDTNRYRAHNDPFANQQIMVNNSAGNANQWRWHKKSITLGKKESLKRLIEDSRVEYTFRWQSLSNFDLPDLASQVLNQTRVTATAPYTLTPMYCFDLTTFGRGRVNSYDIGIDAVDAQAVPMYRLAKFPTAPVGQSPHYQWQPQKGFHNGSHGDADEVWGGIEHISDAGTQISPDVTRFYHHWSDVRLMLKGAQNRPCRIHVKLVNFLEFPYAPQRYYHNAGAPGTITPYDDPVVDIEMAQRIDGYWDQFWGTKDTNPLRSIRNTNGKPLYKVLHSQYYDFAPQNTTDADTIADQKICKMFFNVNQIISTDTGIDDQRQAADEVMLDTVNYTYKNASFRNNFARESNIFSNNKEKSLMLLIYAEQFSKHTSNDPNYGEKEFDPSFDICVRTKQSIVPTPAIRNLQS